MFIEALFIYLMFWLQRFQNEKLFGTFEFWPRIFEYRFYGITWIVPEKFICTYKTVERDLFHVYSLRNNGDFIL